ncbi:MAG: hypothetical protein F4X87_08020 [Chloroflexi bacterium]|nr:hypothetical protein [Chloroflexota bacterium]
MIGWEQVLIIIGTNITVVAGIFLWLRADIKRLEDKVDNGFRGLDDRLRKVETEQARMAGLLEGLGLAGNLPASE